MKEILVLGAGKIGALISGLLAESGGYRVQLADTEPGLAESVAAAHRLDSLTAFDLDASNKEANTRFMARIYLCSTPQWGRPSL